MEGEPDNVRYLINKNTGDRLLTSVSRHIEFIKARKDKHPEDFAQVVRLAKWWVKEMKRKLGDRTAAIDHPSSTTRHTIRRRWLNVSAALA